MLAVPSDISIVGTVLALAVAILLLSGLALYVAFRVRDTLREEKGGGARAAKVAFLIGLLFLSGGVFYFFASGFNASGGNPSGTLATVTSSTTSFTSSTTQSSAATTSSSPSTSSSTTVSTATSPSVTSTGGGPVSMQASYPGSVSVGQGFYIQFSIYNSGSTALTGVSLDLGSVSITFTIMNATTCNPSCSTTAWSGGVVDIGNLNPGSTVVQVGLKAPSSPAQFSGQATLYYQGETQPLSVTVTMRVTGKP